MYKCHLLAGTVVVAASLVAYGPPAQAKTVSVEDNFNFSLNRVFEEDLQLQDVGPSYEGSDTATLAQFDTKGGTRVLDKVALTMNMNISGDLFVFFPTIASRSLTPQQAEEEGEVEVQFSGSAQIGSLNASDTDTFEGDVNDVGENGAIPLNANLSGTDSTTSDFGDFLGTGQIDPAHLTAALQVLYGPEAVGGAETFIASGKVQVTYSYHDAVTTVPSPAAAGAGLLMLVGVVSRRRRRN